MCGVKKTLSSSQKRKIRKEKEYNINSKYAKLDNFLISASSSSCVSTSSSNARELDEQGQAHPGIHKRRIWYIMLWFCNSLYIYIHWCAKIKDEVEKLGYQLNEEAEWTERPIRRLGKVMYGSTRADMQVDVMGECLSSIKHVVG
ncbi:uncharacterized protein TNCV_2927051 [Trichonephila clavipes]|nr:uncharacterized protein TNCV_2927051 [Trichonephila clavipes]